MGAELAEAQALTMVGWTASQVLEHASVSSFAVSSRNCGGHRPVDQMTLEDGGFVDRRIVVSWLSPDETPAEL